LPILNHFYCVVKINMDDDEDEDWFAWLVDSVN
jgi:hypothetical protein